MGRKTISKKIRVLVLARDKYTCQMCGAKATNVELQVDHMIPIASGGTDELSNLRTLCQPCNIGKSNYHFENQNAIDIIPSNIEQLIKLLPAPQTGDFEKYTVALFYKIGSNSGFKVDKFTHEWIINLTTLKLSPDQDALRERLRKENVATFLLKIKKSLIAMGKKLVLNEEGLLLQ